MTDEGVGLKLTSRDIPGPWSVKVDAQQREITHSPGNELVVYDIKRHVCVSR